MRLSRVFAALALATLPRADFSAGNVSNLDLSTPDGTLHVRRDSVYAEHSVTYTPNALAHLSSDERPWDVELGFQRRALSDGSDRFAATLKCCGKEFHGMHEIVLKVGNLTVVRFVPTDRDVHFFTFHGMYRVDGGAVCIPTSCESVELPISLATLDALGAARYGSIELISSRGDTLSAPLGWDHLQLARMTAEWWGRKSP